MVKIIVAAAMIVTSFGAAAQEWMTSIGMSISGPNGYITFRTTNGYSIVQDIYIHSPNVYSVHVPPAIVVPCYNCGQYPQGDPYDPYRNHHHLQCPFCHYHHHYHHHYR